MSHNKKENSSLVLNAEGRNVRLSYWPAAACMASVWLSREQYWGKPWMNYCTFLLFDSRISIIKIVNIMDLFLCTMCISIELWSSIEKRRHHSFLCLLFFLLLLFLVLVTALLLSLRTNLCSTCRSLLLPFCLVCGWRRSKCGNTIKAISCCCHGRVFFLFVCCLNAWIYIHQTNYKLNN